MIKAVIFDMDGVISDTQGHYSQVESEILSRYGISLTPTEITEKYSGVRTKEFFQELLSQQSKPFDIDDLIQEEHEKIIELASKSVDTISGAIDLIKRLKDQGYKLAIASSSISKYVEFVLTTLEIKNYFDAIVSGDMVTNGKPDPEIFLLAANKLEIAPNLCLVIEDAKSGMEAARRAGMVCIGLVTDITKDFPTKNKVTGLNQITLEYIKFL